jgi:hypothetical protein
VSDERRPGSSRLHGRPLDENGRIDFTVDRGKLDAGRTFSDTNDDDVSLRVVAVFKMQLVTLQFSEPIQVYGLPPESARVIAQLLVEAAEHVERGRR